ncbi:MAG TPA: TraR/DksA C4-type zinc finger protein [Gaiellaceae bacterium]|nr:TraR/DksA C4-type zinc finger protein [Gaiellaceae bacterium]
MSIDIDTDRFRAELEQQRDRLQKTITHHDIGGASLTEETGELMSSSADNHLADTASETYERELDEGLEEDAQDQLREVEAALQRIEAGTYGFCSVCGKPIPVERLEAVPWTALCIDDARKLAR